MVESEPKHIMDLIKAINPKRNDNGPLTDIFFLLLVARFKGAQAFGNMPSAYDSKNQ